MFSEGTMPVVKLSLCTMMLKMVEMTAPASMDRNCTMPHEHCHPLGESCLMAAQMLLAGRGSWHDSTVQWGLCK